MDQDARKMKNLAKAMRVVAGPEDAAKMAALHAFLEKDLRRLAEEMLEALDIAEATGGDFKKFRHWLISRL